jgi:glutamate racemase
MCTWLIEKQQCQAVVVACNTATAQAISSIRERFRSLPIIGVEPGVKPAAALSASKKIGVLATQSTLSSEKFKQLLQSLVGDCEVIAQAGVGLVPLIELGDLNNPELDQLITHYVQKIIDAGADTLVLGCTHFPFLAPLIQKKFPDQIHLIDTGAAIVKQLGRKAQIEALPINTQIDLYTSGNPQVLLQQTRNLLQLKNSNAKIHAQAIEL